MGYTLSNHNHKTVIKATICPYCGTASNFSFSYGERNYYRCPCCDLIFVEPMKDSNTAIAHYRSCYFDACAKDQMSVQRKKIYYGILTLLEKYQKSGSLLDVGCGCGFFLKMAKDHGWLVLGVDPSHKSIEYARSLIGEAVLCGTLVDIPIDQRFDAITLINVLDHMPNAFQQLDEIRDHLGADGVLYLRFPNGSLHSFMMRLSRALFISNFMASFLIFHEYAFTKKIIRRCLEDLGYTDIQVFNAPITGGQFQIVGPRFSGFILKIVCPMIMAIFKLSELLSGYRWSWGPSLQVVAKKGS